MTDQSKIAALAAGMVAANPDAAEELGGLLSRAARSVKVGHIHGLGVATRISLVTGRLEMRAGVLDRYIAGEAPGNGYMEVTEETR